MENKKIRVRILTLVKKTKPQFHNGVLLRGAERIRTAVRGFADLCLATRPQHLLTTIWFCRPSRYIGTTRPQHLLTTIWFCRPSRYIGITRPQHLLTTIWFCRPSRYIGTTRPQHLYYTLLANLLGLFRQVGTTAPFLLRKSKKIPERRNPSR